MKDSTRGVLILAVGLILVTVVVGGVVLAAKPGSEPAPDSSRFACFTWHEFPTKQICYDKGDLYTITESSGNDFRSIVPAVGFGANVKETIAEITAALGQ